MRNRNSLCVRYLASSGFLVLLISCGYLSLAVEQLHTETFASVQGARGDEFVELQGPEQHGSHDENVIGETALETPSDPAVVKLDQDPISQLPPRPPRRHPPGDAKTASIQSKGPVAAKASSATAATSPSPSHSPSHSPSPAGVHLLSLEECPVDRVIVYQDRADVTRIVDVEVESGEVEVRVRGLTAGMVAGSARVQGRGDATILEVVEGFVDEEKENMETRQAEIEGLRRRLMEAESADSRLEIRTRRQLTRLDEERGLVLGITQRVSTCSTEGLQAALQAGGWSDPQALLTFAREKLSALDDEAVTLEEAKAASKSLVQELQSNLTRLQNPQKQTPLRTAASHRLGRSSRRTGPPLGQVSVMIEAAKAGTVQLELRYMTYQASWSPSYDCRGDSNGGSLVAALTYHGAVRQSTGEDWTKASLQLSTAQPSLGGNIPSLPPVNLDFYQEPRRYRNRERGGAGSYMMAKSRAMPQMASVSTSAMAMDEGMDMMTDEDGEAEMEMAPELEMRSQKKMFQSVSSVAEGTIGAVFSISKRTSIPSDGLPHKVVIGVVEFPPSFSYVAVPRAQPRAFLVSEAINNSPYPLLPGELHVFLDGTATTTTDLPLVAPNENFTVSFGVDEAVRVKQIPVPKLEEDKGLFYGETKKRTMHHKMSIVNTKQMTIDVEVRDSIPQSSQKDLKVAITQKTTVGSSGVKLSFEQPNSHEVKWKCNLAPGSEQALDLKYTIEWPKDKEIVGLP